VVDLDADLRGGSRTALAAAIKLLGGGVVPQWVLNPPQ